MSARRKCRRCGCTQSHITEKCQTKSKGNGCYWVEKDLCSACLTPHERRRVKKGQVVVSDREYKHEVVDAIDLQILTLMDSFGDPLTLRMPNHIFSEVECLQRASILIKASHMT